MGPGEHRSSPAARSSIVPTPTGGDDRTGGHLPHDEVLDLVGEELPGGRLEHRPQGRPRDLTVPWAPTTTVGSSLRSIALAPSRVLHGITEAPFRGEEGTLSARRAWGSPRCLDSIHTPHARRPSAEWRRLHKKALRLRHISPARRGRRARRKPREDGAGETPEDTGTQRAVQLCSTSRSSCGNQSWPSETR